MAENHKNPPAAPVDPASPEALTYLPNGWQAAMLDLAGRGKHHGAFIQMLGLAPQDFYILAKRNALFAEWLARAHAAGLEWLESKFVAIVDGDANPQIQKTLEMLFNARFKDFAEIYSPENAQSAGLDAIPTPELLQAVEKRGYLTRISQRAECGGGDSVVDLARVWGRYFNAIAERVENGELDHARAKESLELNSLAAGWDFDDDGWEFNENPPELSAGELLKTDRKIKRQIINDERWQAGKPELPPPQAEPQSTTNAEILPAEPPTEPEPEPEPELTHAQKMARLGGF